jgi:hypothetical protein
VCVCVFQFCEEHKTVIIGLMYAYASSDVYYSINDTASSWRHCCVLSSMVHCVN